MRQRTFSYVNGGVDIRPRATSNIVGGISRKLKPRDWGTRSMTSILRRSFISISADVLRADGSVKKGCARAPPITCPISSYTRLFGKLMPKWG